jgi:hypothetical protein
MVLVPGSGFKVQGSGFKGSRFQVRGSKVQGSRLRVQRLQPIDTIHHIDKDARNTDIPSYETELAQRTAEYRTRNFE